MKTNKIMGTLVMSAFAGALASTTVFAAKSKAKISSDMYCMNNCAGKSACHGQGNNGSAECAGKNGCAGQGMGIRAKNAKACKKADGKWVKKKVPQEVMESDEGAEG